MDQFSLWGQSCQIVFCTFIKSKCNFFYHFFFQEKEEDEQERREREYVERMAAERLASLEGGDSLNLQQTQELLNGNVVEQSPQDMPNKL